MNNIKETLKKLGFSAQETDIYLSLLKIGESPVGPIIAETGYHREIVYSALKRLEQQGYLQAIEKKKIRHYQITDPKILVQKMEDKAELARETLPSLKALYKQPAVLVKIYEGADGFEEIEKDWATSLKDNEEFYCIGGAGDAWYEITKDYYKKYHNRLYKRGIRVKTVTFANEAKGIAKYEEKSFNPTRVLPDKFRVPSSTIIYADKILIQVFGESPLGIVIQSEAISKSYKQYFDLLWEMGEDI